MSSTDFLKSCKTNVRIVEDLFSTPYGVYKTSDVNIDEDELLYAVKDLRSQNVLCSISESEIWVFGKNDALLSELLEGTEHSLRLAENGMVREVSEQRVGARTVKEVLLDAVEASVSFTLAQQHDVLHVGFWQWLFHSSDDSTAQGHGRNVLLKLEVTVTDKGTLYLSTTSEPCFLSTMPHRDNTERVVILAPSGQTAKSVNEGCESDSVTHEREKPIVGCASWKQKVASSLSAEGIEISDNDEWIAFELSNDAVSSRVLWPMRLCSKHELPTDVVTKPDWRYWFNSTSADDATESYQNPLAWAEDLFNNATTMTDETNADSVLATHDLPTAADTVDDSPLATSPPFTQRTADAQAAMAGIYPTPPDGFVPSHSTTMQSTSDALQPQRSNESGPLLGSDDAQPDQHRHSVASSTDPFGLQNSGMGVDDLFGDMGMGEMDELGLGANEVGDADFDYFDDPDEAAIEDERSEVGQDIFMGENERVAVQHVHADSNDRNADVLSQHEGLIVLESEGVAESSSNPSEAIGHTFDRIDDSSAPEDGDIAVVEPEKPLSPFSIRERLLPPPIPASANHSQITSLRRSSTFDALSFNQGLDLNTRRWQHGNLKDRGVPIAGQAGPNINLPSTRKRKKEEVEKERDLDSGVDGLIGTSESSEEDSTSSLSELKQNGIEDESWPPKLPWESKKRKRIDSNVSIPDSSPLELVEGWLEQAESEQISQTLQQVLLRSQASTCRDSHVGLNGIGEDRNHGARKLPSIEDLYELTKLDLMYIAQIIGEQATTASTKLVSECQGLHPATGDQSTIATAIPNLLASAIDHVLPAAEEGDFTKLALIKEPPQRQTPASGKTPQTPQPRPQMREGSMQLGPDYFSIPPPFVRVQRGGEPWELLPPALSFWSALGIGPASGSKNVSMVCLSPDNAELIKTWKDFRIDLGRTYDGYKLGSLTTLDKGHEPVDDGWDDVARLVQDGVCIIKSDGEDLTNTLREYAISCTSLGTALAGVGHLAPDRTIAVCMIDPIENHPSARQHLCACFWLLCKAYRDNIPKTHRSLSQSDLVLQILPVSTIASEDGLVFLNAQQLGALAIELYDRCPPSAKAALDVSSPLPIPAAPAVQLASLPPKRIGFQPSADPPSDLLHEGSILHLAYACSGDGEWVSVCWVDSTAQYQRSSSVCLRGRSFKDVAEEVWEQSLDILSAREVMWRVFIVSPDSDEDGSFRRCWKKVVTSKPRKQVLHVTLLSVDISPAMQLIPPVVDVGKAANSASTPGAGFLTPGSTPQAASFTVSPDASGQTNAPPTPAPSDAATNIIESDPDACLVDSTDESWAMLLAHQLIASSSSVSKSASGLLFRRCSDNDQHEHLKAIQATLHWEVRLRPNGLIDEGPPKQAEANLRDVLKMFRSLCLLTKIRGLERYGEGSLMPVHVNSAICGVAALKGLVGAVE